ncbi:hypothetical protein [Xanthomonas campestris]|uniref:hypothetical protein n=1 Tax=Xanthomonas campestris TaxID=339 RepID=UPI0015F29FD7|nr:hypothetical protein [Xanthomonas campestris]
MAQGFACTGALALNDSMTERQLMHSEQAPGGWRANIRPYDCQLWCVQQEDGGRHRCHARARAISSDARPLDGRMTLADEDRPDEQPRPADGGNSRKAVNAD